VLSMPMFLKRIDRYVSRSFLVTFCGMLFVIFGLYAGFDLLKRIDEIQELGVSEALRAVGVYYGYLFPLFVHDSAPAVLMMAAGLTLVKMSRYRELLILKASGVSIYRVTMPIFLWTLILTGALFWFRESVVSVSTKKKELIARKLDRDRGRGLLLEDRNYGFHLFVYSYDFSDNSMKRPSLIELYPSGMVKRLVEADEGHLRGDGNMYLQGAKIRTFNERGVAVASTNQNTPRSMTIKTVLTPFDMHRAKSESETGKSLFLTLPKLALKMREYPNLPHFAVLYHSRLASVFTPFILLLVGIPCLVGFEHHARSRFLGVIVSILVATGYYTIMFVCTSMGNTGVIDPALAGWLPVIIVGPCGVWLFESMRS